MSVIARDIYKNSISVGLLKVTLVLMAIIISVLSVSAQGGERRSSDSYFGKTTVSVNKSKNIPLPIKFREVIAGASDIADVIPVRDNTLYVLGKKIGTTNVTVYDAEKRLIGVLDIEVEPDLAFIRTRVLSTISNAKNIKLSSANGKIIISGSVPDKPTAERILTVVAPFTKDGSASGVINALKTLDPPQVSLDVRIVEIQRAEAKSVGIRLNVNIGNNTNSTFGREKGIPGSITPTTTVLNNNAIPYGVLGSSIGNSGVTVGALLQALENKGTVRQLAKPNLTALSGSTASFLAGGEIPISTGVSQTGQASITWKKFGIMLQFTPTIYDNGLIALKLTPEVSDLDFTRALTQGGFSIPAIVVRRAETEVILKSGQSFAIAGLLSQKDTRDIAQAPWLGDVPVLGALFRSPSFQKNETELVIIVTANLVQPATPRDRLRTPMDQTSAVNDRDFFLRGRMELLKSYNHYIESGTGIQGPYGHILEVK
jgi:pilus assembly protein CpaC